MKEAAGHLSPAERIELLQWLKRLSREQSAAQRHAKREASNTLKSAVLLSVSAIGLFLLTDGILFHSGIYNRYIEPQSSAGEMEGHLKWFHDAPRHEHEVVVVGDSRIAEGFSAKAATLAAHGQVHFTNFGLPGSSPRDWYYLIRDADPGRDRLEAIVIAMSQYSDQDLSDNLQDRTTDMHYLAGRLRYTDCIPFARSFLSIEASQTALASCLLRGIPFRPDVQAFLRAPKYRRTRALDWMAHGQSYIDDYSGKPESVAGISADFAARRLVFPPALNEAQRGSISATVFPSSEPQTGMLTKYRQQWLGAILDLYRNSKTRIVFAELPRAPLPVPEPPSPPRFLQQAASRPRTVVLPSSTFRDLERPDLFADGLHLNHDGRPVFSARLAERTAAVLASH